MFDKLFDSKNINHYLFAFGLIMVASFFGNRFKQAFDTKDDEYEMIRKYLLNDTPLLNEPGVTKLHKDYTPYNRIIEYVNIDFAICELLDRSKNKIPTQFISFYPFMKEQFLKKYEKLVAIVEAKSGLDEHYYVQIYQMSTRVNYNLLKAKLLTTKENVGV